MMGMHECCSCAAHSPQSSGQPFSTGVENLSGTEPSLMYVAHEGALRSVLGAELLHPDLSGLQVDLRVDLALAH
jgi:hypothetical protein